MNDTNIQQQINDINLKLDRVLEYVNDQRLKREMADDLMKDLSIIGKDAYQSTVDELDKQNIEIDPEEVKILVLKLLKNMNNFSVILNMFESIMDLSKDLAPLTREATIDFIYKLHELDSKGYFEFFSSVTKILDNIVTHYTKEDVELLADNIVTILDTVKSITQPDMLHAMNNAVAIYKDLDPVNVPEYSVWKAIRELSSPEMKKGIGFIFTYLKGLSRGKTQNNNV